MLSDATQRRLVRWNVAMALLHGAFVAATLLAADMGMTLPLYAVAYGRSPVNVSGAWIAPGAIERDRHDLHIAWVALAFSALSMAFHLLNAYGWREWYLTGIGEARCPSRWIEYSLSCPMQGVAIAYLTGSMLTDQIVACFALLSTTQFFGLLCEELSRPAGPDAWTRPALYRLMPHLMGYFPFGVAVAIILQGFARASQLGDEGDSSARMPEFVYYIVVTQLLLFSSFSVVQLVVTLLPPRHFAAGEVAYQVLSLAAKAVLSLLLLANVIAISVFQ